MGSIEATVYLIPGSWIETSLIVNHNGKVWFEREITSLGIPHRCLVKGLEVNPFGRKSFEISLTIIGIARSPKN
jgi:hypothetical protein